jgi:hydroxypyruvate reductase
MVIGAGKASAQMALGREAVWDAPLAGLVVTSKGNGVGCRRVEVAEAGHPIPDRAGFLAAQRIMSMADGLTEDDLVIALISGGGSALLPLPGPF